MNKIIPIPSLKESEIEVYTYVVDYSRFPELNRWQRLLVAINPQKYSYLLFRKEYIGIDSLKYLGDGAYEIEMSEIPGGTEINFVVTHNGFDIVNEIEVP